MIHNSIQWKPFFISIAISLGTGLITGLLTANSMETYRTLYKPPLSPPGWVFPIVWTILFLLMGIASYLIYVSGSVHTKQALKIYVIQLLVNAIWPILFFRLNAYILSFAWIILLWYLVYMMIKIFYEISPLAGKLLIPYIIWLTFAAYLNFSIALYYVTKIG